MSQQTQQRKGEISSQKLQLPFNYACAGAKKELRFDWPH